MKSLNGTYTSSNGQFTLTITEYDAPSGTFKGSYAYTGETPQGRQNFNLVAGHWFHVVLPDGSEPAVSVSFTGVARSSTYSHCILDTWSGILTEGGVISASGVRSYLLAGQPHQLTNLDTHTLSTGTTNTGIKA